MKKNKDVKRMYRRDFINNMARASILIGLSVMSGVLLFKNESTEECDFQFVCSKCRNLSACSLPEATKFKEINSLK
ncbi:MAG: hypothetical protein ACOYOV_10255 [Bacteroidales bacterium]